MYREEHERWNGDFEIDILFSDIFSNDEEYEEYVLEKENRLNIRDMEKLV